MLRRSAVETKNRSTKALGAALNSRGASLPEAVRASGFECAQHWQAQRRGLAAPPDEEMREALIKRAAEPNNAVERTRVRRSRCAFPPLAAHLGR
jgi:hypothetical protein